MADKVAIITGGGGAIGKAIATRLAGKGYIAVLFGRTESTLRQAADRIAKATYVVVDVSDPSSVQKAFAEVADRFGRLDALVNNAGVAPVLMLEQTSLDDWRDVIDTNLSSVFYCCRQAWPMFRRSGGGAVVNISSMAARDPFPGFVAYGAAKAGVNTLTLSLSQEGKSMNVRVYAVAPGAVETPMLRKIVSANDLPTSQTLQPDEIAAAVEECIVGSQRYVSGQTIWLQKQ